MSNGIQDFRELFLGFDPVTEKYKLLHVFIRQSRVKILTLGTNSLREIELIPGMPSPSYFGRNCVFLDGLLFWRTCLFNSPINYFDFTEEKFGIASPPTILWEKLVSYPSSLGNIYKKCHLIKFNSDDSNSEMVALHKAEGSDWEQHVLATTNLIGVPSSLVLPDHFELRHVSSFVENIIPLTFIYPGLVL